jgi:hypothetical protein
VYAQVSLRARVLLRAAIAKHTHPEMPHLRGGGSDSDAVGCARVPAAGIPVPAADGVPVPVVVHGHSVTRSLVPTAGIPAELAKRDEGGARCQEDDAKKQAVPYICKYMSKYPVCKSMLEIMTEISLPTVVVDPVILAGEVVNRMATLQEKSNLKQTTYNKLVENKQITKTTLTKQTK